MGMIRPSLIGKLVPSLAAMLNQIIVGFEDTAGEPVVAHELPDISHRDAWWASYRLIVANYASMPNPINPCDIAGNHLPMSDIASRPRTKVRPKTKRPRLHKVILVNDDFTPREFVVIVLKAEFRMNADQAQRVMITAHKRGSCVVAVYPRDVAETKATKATDAGRSMGYPLLFTTEPEE